MRVRAAMIALGDLIAVLVCLPAMRSSPPAGVDPGLPQVDRET
jgi:hypothetical protein